MGKTDQVQTLNNPRTPGNVWGVGPPVFREFITNTGNKMTMNLTKIICWEKDQDETMITIEAGLGWHIKMAYSKFDQIMKENMVIVK